MSYWAGVYLTAALVVGMALLAVCVVALAWHAGFRPYEAAVPTADSRQAFASTRVAPRSTDGSWAEDERADYRVLGSSGAITLHTAMPLTAKSVNAFLKRIGCADVRHYIEGDTFSQDDLDRIADCLEAKKP